MATSAKAFIDTNILVYQFDKSAPAKQKRAIELIELSIINESTVISSQVIQEFMGVALKSSTLHLLRRAKKRNE